MTMTTREEVNNVLAKLETNSPPYDPDFVAYIRLQTTLLLECREILADILDTLKSSRISRY